MAFAKLSLSLPSHLHQWLTDEHDRSGVPVSALVARALDQARELEELRAARAVRVQAALAELSGKPLTERELDRARAELRELGLL
jgi:hypothetical protein